MGDTSKIYVDSAEALRAALDKANGGETIVLADGNYGDLRLGHHFDDTVTLISANPGQATFDSMMANGAGNVTFDGVTFDYSYSLGDSLGQRSFRVDNSTGITIRNAVFDGDDSTDTSSVHADYPIGKALDIGNSQDITVESSTVTGFWKGLMVGGSQDVVMRGNEIYDIRSDGINIVDSKGVLVEDNHIRDFRTNPDAGDHVDFIQMYPTGYREVPSDITIRDNVLDMGEGGIGQSIFLTQPKQTHDRLGDDNAYKNLEVTGNVVIGGHTHGIRIDETEGLVVANNTLVRPLEGNEYVTNPRIMLSDKSTDVSVTGNVVSEITGLHPDWTVDNNVTVDHADPNAPGYYGKLFINGDSDFTNALENLQVLPGGPLDGSGAGAPRLAYTDTPETLTALGRAETGESRASFDFDGRFSAGPDGPAAADGAVFTWDFGDGTTATGAQASHTYAAPGEYAVTLRVEMPDGRVDTSQIAANVAGPDVVSFAAGQEMQVWSHGTSQALGMQTPNTDADGNMVFDGDRVWTDRGPLSELFGADGFEITATLRADDSGEILRQHASFEGWIGGDGDLGFTLRPEGGETVSVRTDSGSLLDGDWHDIRIAYDGQELSVQIDDNPAASVAASGALKPMMSWGLAFGGGFEGAISALDIKAEPTRYDFAAPDIAPDAAPDVAPEDPFGPADGFDLQALDPQADLPELWRDAEGTPGLWRNGDGAVSAVLEGTDKIDLGRIHHLEDSQKIGLTMNFEMLEEGGRRMLISNPRNIEVSVVGDRMKFEIGTADGSMVREFTGWLDDLKEGGPQALRLEVDAEANTVTAMLNGEEIYSHTGSDLQLAGGIEYGWSLGSRWDKDHADVRIDDVKLYRLDDAPAAPDEAAAPKAVAPDQTTAPDEAAVTPDQVTSAAAAPDGVAAGDAATTGDGARLEAGRITFSQDSATDWHQVTFDAPIEDARVVMGPLSANGSDPATMRVRNVTDEGFEVQIDEWDYLNGAHTTETVSWIAGTAGTHEIGGDQTIAFGRLSAADERAEYVDLSGFDAAPTVIAQVTSANDPDAVTDRIDGVTAEGFSVAMQEEEAGDGDHGTETIDWMAVENGDGAVTAGQMGGVTHEAIPLNLDDSGDNIAFLADMQSVNGTNTANLRLDIVDGQSDRIFIDEETSLDWETGHTEEQIGYIAIDPGHYELMS